MDKLVCPCPSEELHMNYNHLHETYNSLKNKTLESIKEKVSGTKVRFNDLSMRDGHQSLFATRMTGEQISRVLYDIVDCGFYDLEVWGGATLDVCLRYLDENPFERLQMICDAARGKTYTRALLRGVNLFGYSPYPPDIVEAFCKAAHGRGLDIMRIFDALNDPNNLEAAVKSVKKYKGLVDAAVSYTTGPIYDTAYYTDKFKTYEELGADMVTVKDMAGLATPEVAWELMPALKNHLDIPIKWHSHCTPGFGHITSVIGLMCGIDMIDTCFLPFAGGSSHPSVELLHAFAKRLGIDDGMDTSRFAEIDGALRKVRKELKDYDSFKDIPEPFEVDEELGSMMDDIVILLGFGEIELATRAMHHLEAKLGFPPPDDAVRAAQVPGGMLSNMYSQLEGFGMKDRLGDVLKEIPIVRQACGYVPLVTPTSQIVGVQAVNNVKFGRWKNNITDYVRLVRGEFGQTPVDIDPKYREEITGSPEEIRYDATQFDYTLPPTQDFTADELYPDREFELLYYLFPKVAGGKDGFLEKRARERREQLARDERDQYLDTVRSRAQFKLSGKNPRTATLSEEESEALHTLLVAEVTGEYPNREL